MLSLSTHRKSHIANRLIAQLKSARPTAALCVNIAFDSTKATETGDECV